MDTITEYSRTRLAELLNIFADVPVSNWGHNPHMWELMELVRNGTVTLDMVYRIYVEVASTEHGWAIIQYLCEHPLTIHYLQQIMALPDNIIPPDHKGMCMAALDRMHAAAMQDTLQACSNCPHPAGHCGWSMCPKS